MDLVKGWNELGVVGTIYEEEDEDSPSDVASIPSPEFTPSPSPKFSGMEQRSSVRFRDPDVVIHVKDSYFRLHKEVMIRRSGYLKRQLDEFFEIILSPPLNITADTFSLVKDFCYGTYLAITPFNVAALRTAAELLDMTEMENLADGNLLQITEAYFCRTIAINKECASIVLEASISLLPEAETKATLVSRSIEAISLMDEAEGYLSCLEGVKGLKIEELQLVLEATSQRLIDCHDFLYRIIDLHLKENNSKISEDEKIRICNYIDCSILSPTTLMHAVQNPNMPLRFVVQAMFVEQLNTRRTLISATDHRTNHKNPKKDDPISLGAILQRDTALRQVEQLKSVMNSTNSRIQSLEKELNGMRKVLSESENIKNRIDAGRSASSRFSSETEKIGRGQIGSVSSLSVRDVRNKLRAKECSSEKSSDGSFGVEKNFGQRLMSGIKSAFRLQSLGLKKKGDNKGRIKVEMNQQKFDKEDWNEDIVVIKKNQAFHRRSRSQV